MRIFTIAATVLIAAAPLTAQEPLAVPGSEQQVVDRVIAVVGDTVMLLSDLQAEIQQYQAMTGQQLPTDPFAQEQLIRQLIETAVSEMVLQQAARKAGVTVRAEAIQDMVNQEVRAAQQRFGSEAEFVRALAASGMTLEQYRAMVFERYQVRAIRDQYVRQRMARMPRPNVTEAEIRATFAASGSEMQTRPATVSFEQVIITPEPSAEARDAALATAQDILGQLHQGGDFEVLARRFSDDPGSRQHGGDLGWFRRGSMVPAFERAVYALRPGQISPIVETEFGFHIIRLERVRGTERQARHILIRPEITDEDRARAQQRADSVAAAIRGGAPMPQIRMPAGVPADQRTVERVVIARLPEEYGEAFSDASAGTVVGPFRTQLSQEPGWVVARVTAQQPEGRFTLDDVREQIVEHVQMQKMEASLVDDLRRGMFVEIRI
jgi:peptidyl-prolyl cis-trans isomerase SurA